MAKQNKKVTLPEGVTDEMIAAWMERYGEGKVKLASLPVDDDCSASIDVIIRAPGRKEVSEFEKWMDKNPDKAKEILVNTCLLTRKDEVKANEYLFFGAYDAIAQLLQLPKATLKNL